MAHDHAPRSPATTTDPALVRLIREFADRWQIEPHETLPVLTATHRSGDGRHNHCIVAHSATELHAKLTAVKP